MTSADTERGTFTYSNPAVVHWGPGCLAGQLDDELGRLAVRRAFVVTTRSVAGNRALIGILEERLGDRLVGCFAGIGQHAPALSVAEAVRAAREAGPDVLVSLGGGSPIDAAKAVAFALATDLDLADPSAPARAARLSLAGRSVLPHLAIPTTLSAAEMSAGAGFSAVESREKVGLRAPELLPTAVFYDAELSLQTPPELWLSTGIRAVDHAVEGILSRGKHPFQDTMALEALRRLGPSLQATRSDPSDLEARTQSQLGAWFSMTLPIASAAGLSHTLGKRLGSRHDIPHGITSCLLLPHVMRYLAPTTAEQQARIAVALGVASEASPADAAAGNAADAVRDLIGRLGQPQHLGEYGLSDADLVEAARPLAGDRYSLDDLVAIYRAAW